MIYDPDADQPVYAMVTTAKTNDITPAKAMPIEAGATYVFDMGYYDFAWWAKLDHLGCRIVTRFKSNTKLTDVTERTVPKDQEHILSDRIGLLPPRVRTGKKNPLSRPVREICVRIPTGKILRILCNNLKAAAHEITASINADGPSNYSSVGSSKL